MAQPSNPTTSVNATCHCGAVKITVPEKPKEINECQCTVCRRWGAAWAYYDPSNVEITVDESSPTRQYVWGDRELCFTFCGTCGCVTHWKSIVESQEMGVNTRMMDPEVLKTVERKVDHEQLSVPLNSKGSAHPDDRAQYS